jgi:hypothetical protein
MPQAKIFFFLLATTISTDLTMDNATTNLGSHGNNGNRGNGGDERRPARKEPGEVVGRTRERGR